MSWRDLFQWRTYDPSLYTPSEILQNNERIKTLSLFSNNAGLALLVAAVARWFDPKTGFDGAAIAALCVYAYSSKRLNGNEPAKRLCSSDRRSRFAAAGGSFRRLDRHASSQSHEKAAPAPSSMSRLPKSRLLKLRARMPIMSGCTT